ncbi:helix-turn-helix domain-containing protein [Bacillus spizizenii]|nr:helix-turn-helix domain-containing protein [Bacillus spizizenii]MCY8902925.1 helix-turn-helix domain-containing protein [Bacillus spizizenii]MCY8907050.1 helix-turn-helix domain-containing protein [Bacillus spizizenii]
MENQFKRQWLAERRSKADLSYRQLSKETGLATSFLWKIENGVATPSFETVIKLGKALRFEPEFFYTQEVSFKEQMLYKTS